MLLAIAEFHMRILLQQPTQEELPRSHAQPVRLEEDESVPAVEEPISLQHIDAIEAAEHISVGRFHDSDVQFAHHHIKQALTRELVNPAVEGD